MHCTSCGSPNENAARFCASCGKPLGSQQANLGAPSGPQVCAACGAAFVNGKCDRCGGQQGVGAPAPAQGVHWVQLRLSIKCATCHRSSPLNRLDTEGRFYCFGCSRDMFFDKDLWKEYVLFMASALGDAYWANANVFPAWPTGFDTTEVAESEAVEEICDENAIGKHVLEKCIDIGRKTGGLTLEKGGMTISADGMRTSACALEMSPGYPLCNQCKTPLAIQLPEDGVVTTSCARCGTHDTYRAPQAAKAACSDFCGVIAHEHVEGRETARIAVQGAVIAVACPKCGSALQLTPGARIAQCSYCKTTCVVPDQVASAGAAPASPEPVWLAFRAPSGIRNAIGKAAADDAADAKDDVPAERQEADGAEARRRKQAEAAEAQQRTSRVTMLATMGALAVTGVIAAGVVFEQHEKHGEKDKDKKEGHDGKQTALTPTAKPKRADPVVIPSCTCSFGDGQSTPQVTLTLQAPPSGSATFWLDIEKTSGFVSEGRTSKLPPAPGALLPPWADAGPAPSRLGIACDTGIFVLVGDKLATGWSSINAAWKWNTTLPSPSVDAADAGTSALAGSDYAGGCTQLSVKNGTAALTLANGKHVALSLRDGKIK